MLDTGSDAEVRGFFIERKRENALSRTGIPVGRSGGQRRDVLARHFDGDVGRERSRASHMIDSSFCSRKSRPRLMSSRFLPPVRMIFPELKRSATIFGSLIR